MNISYFNNTKTNATQHAVEHIFSGQVEGIIRAIYVILTLIGISGNGLVLYLIATKRVERTVFNILLANLSFADLLADISLYPYIFIDLHGFDLSPLQGSILCNFTIGLTIFFTCTAVSLLTLTTISINRYICINHPLRFEWQQSKQCVVYFIPVTWSISVALLVPNYVSFSYKKEWGVCHREWPENFNGILYTLITSFFGLLVPIIVLLSTFIVTLKNLRAKVSDYSSTSNSIRYSRQRTIRLLGWLIILFCICWMPFFIYWCLSRAAHVFDDGIIGDYQRMRVIRLTIMVAVINTTIDPIIYALFSEQYRTALRRIVNRNASVMPMNSMATYATSIHHKRHRFITHSERSSFSTKALDEEFRERMTPKTSIVMAHIRATPEAKETVN